jgi:hypothetical protein
VQLKQLQCLLGFVSEEKVVLFALLVSASYCGYLYEVEQRHKISSTKTAKRQLTSIAKKSIALAGMLEEHPISERLVRRPAKNFEKWLEENSKFESDDGVIQIWRLQEEDHRRLNDLIEGLKIVSEIATYYLDNDEQFRDAVHLPRREDEEKTAVRVHFWPSLFIIWRQAGKSVAGGENGPLHRFISLVHQACGLANVSASTLRDAVSEWNQRRAKMEAEWQQRFGHLDIAEDQP